MSFEKKDILRLLWPFALLYGIAVKVRNILFDKGIFKSHSFPLPVICIGNLTVGGTGKTPHTEYLIQLLSHHYKVSVLSRGYRRKTKGFYVAHAESTAHDIGDEPSQIKHKFPDITVAVCAQRTEGIRRLIAGEGDTIPDVILLDDAYQHRQVKAGLNILLTDSHRLISEDYLLPVGRLREDFSGRLRADIVIVTKCAPDITCTEMDRIASQLQLLPHQKLFFSSLSYGHLFGAWTDVQRQFSTLGKDTHIFLITGIAHPEPLLHQLQQTQALITSIRYPDHHHFSTADIRHINKIFADLSDDGKDAIIVTTEKDAARLRLCQGLSESVQRHLYILPIQVTFIGQQEELFHQTIMQYVRENQ